MWTDELDKLHHVEKALKDGGRVVVLNTGAAIPPEAEAMLQALHSRSTGGIREHLETLKKKGGADKFMSGFYVGYGHKSIGDCGSATIFIEGVSMLAAKAVQDWPLYSGQESSTRYIDFAKQYFIVAHKSGQSEQIQENWRKFYLDAREPLEQSLNVRFPRQQNEKESVYNKAISARAFDILRGFLPAGAATNLAWHTNMRQAADKLMLLRHHPLAEVRDIAQAVEMALAEAYPSSFGHQLFANTEEYNKHWMTKGYYLDEEMPEEFAVLADRIETDMLAINRRFLETRPMKTELPKYLAECGTLQFAFLLDFGSFRDLQRHRAIIQRMPLLTMRHGFENWYLEELPKSLNEQARQLLKDQEERIERLGLRSEEKQYYIPMGYRVANRITGSLPAMVYLVELRGTRFVHPTLVARARQMANELEKRFAAYGLRLHMDTDPGRFDVKRGEHDIVAK
jgi:thymidylate synthase ThyX